MKFNYIIILILCCFITSVACAQNSLQGKITDAEDSKTIFGAVVTIPELKLGASSDSIGQYNITSLPKGTYTVEARLLSCATITKKITINGVTTMNFSLSTVSCCTEPDVVITALGNITNTQRSPVPVTMVSHQTMLEETSTTVIDAIASQPGVNMTTEGPGTTKPQINGLGFNRVLTLFDGVPQEDFQWGDDHGLLIDPYAVYDAEIIRGPASLQYGSSAEAGVISFKSEPFVESGTVQGSVLTEYQTNNGYIGNSEDVGGNNNGFVWNLRASNEEAHDYWNPKDGYVWGSAWQQSNARFTLGLIKKWGYTRLSVSTLHRRIQVPDGNRDSTGAFIFDNPQYGQTYPTRSNFLAYDPTIAGDKILDEDQIWWQNSINAGKGRIGIDVGYTESIHHDIKMGTVGAANFDLKGIPYSIKYKVAGDSSGLNFIGGFNGKYENQTNFPEDPAPYISNFQIPNYTNFEIGGYAILQKDYENLTLSAGLRYDITNFKWPSMYLLNAGTPQQQMVSAETPGAMTQFNAFNNNYSGVSGSIGASYQLPDNNYLKLNVAKSYRVASISELTSNGQNIGSNAYQFGNLNLKPEEGYQVDFAYGNNGSDVSFEADGFYNYINNFIFATRTDSVLTGLPVFQYTSNTAVLTGVSGYFNIHPVDTKWLEIDNGGTFIYTYLPNQTDSTNHVPWTPAPHLTTEVKFKLNDKPHSILRGAYFKIGQAKYWAQNNVYSALYTELPSAAYSLYNAGIGTNFVNPKTGRVICSFYVNCTNLLNLAYADHLNLAQYFYGVNGNLVTITPQNQNQGIYNMGRNVGFKLIFPIGGHKVSETEAKGPSDN